MSLFLKVKRDLGNENRCFTTGGGGQDMLDVC